MKKIILISDFSINDLKAPGGAELYNNELINLLKDKYEVLFCKSTDVNLSFLKNNKDYYFIISNFMFLNEENKNFIYNNIKYCILEHDHKYCANNNPSIYNNFLIPENLLINRNFYYNAKAVLCQSELHSSIVKKNLLKNNVINLKCNLWSLKEIEFLENIIDTKKEYQYSIFNTNNLNKGTDTAISYCLKNNIKYNSIYPSEQNKFLLELAKTESLIFFPNWVETYNRMCVEARILGCKIITNNLVGSTKEQYFKNLKGRELLEYIKNYREVLKELYINIIEDNLNKEDYYCSYNKLLNFNQKYILTEIVSLYNAKNYLLDFLLNIEKQKLFDKTKIILINANSPTRSEEEKILEPFLTKNKNMEYISLNNDPGIYGVWNLGINLADTEFVCNSNVDDLRFDFATEFLIESIVDTDHILAYGDAYSSSISGKIASQNLYEHSINSFSKENMIKCLPGAMPVWRKNNIKFDEKYKYAGDWEYWLRLVDSGMSFRKINYKIGIYYHNPEGLSTSENFQKERFQEEKEIFENYKHIFPINYNFYKNYFQIKV